MTDEPAKLLMIEEVLKRMETKTDTSLKVVQDTLNNVRDDFQTHLISNAVQEKRLGDVETTVRSHDNTLHGERGLVKRVEAQEQFTQGLQKVIWEMVRPVLAMMGAGLLIGLSIVVLISYGLISLLNRWP